MQSQVFQILFDIALLRLLEGKGLSAGKADSLICYAPHTFYLWATPSVGTLTSHLVLHRVCKDGSMEKVLALEELGIPGPHLPASRVWELPVTTALGG